MKGEGRIETRGNGLGESLTPVGRRQVPSPCRAYGCNVKDEGGTGQGIGRAEGAQSTEGGGEIPSPGGGYGGNL